jgi:hypothetical protein
MRPLFYPTAAAKDARSYAPLGEASSARGRQQNHISIIARNEIQTEDAIARSCRNKSKTVALLERKPLHVSQLLAPNGNTPRRSFQVLLHMT